MTIRKSRLSQRIPVSAPVISALDRRTVAGCLESGWVSSSGKFVSAFENDFAKYLNVKFALTVSSGTCALHLALASLEIGEGDEVIMPDLTIVSDAFAAMYLGATPVLVDVERESGNIDPALIEKKITRKTRAIIVVHLFGRAAKMRQILRIAQKHGIPVVEDAAQAIGVTCHGRRIGGLGAVGIFSFFGNKTITTGEGGMLVTNDIKLYEKAKLLKNLSHRHGERFRHDRIGFNYRMTNMQAALGLSQLKGVNGKIKKKQHISRMYDRLLHDIPFLEVPEKDICWMFDLLVSADAPFKRDELMHYLNEEGIETRPYFYPLHRQGALQAHIAGKGLFPVADSLSERGFYLPSGLNITDEQIKRVCSVIRAFISRQ